MEMQKFLPPIDESKIERMLSIRERYDAKDLSKEQAQEQLKSEVGFITAYELAYAEQKLNKTDDEECIKENLQTVRDLYGDLLNADRPVLPQGHPLANYYAENDEIEKLVLKMQALRGKEFIKNEWLILLETLQNVRIHQARKQNQLYSALEKKGFDKPNTTMWTYDNLIRDEITAQLDRLRMNKIMDFLATQEELEYHLLDLMDKENTILYPTSLNMISDEEFEKMSVGDREIGYCFIPEPPLYKVSQPLKESNNSDISDTNKPIVNHGFLQELSVLLQKYAPTSETESGEKKTIFEVAQGQLTLEQINLLFQHMPVDLSYVDENELVKFYSDTKTRIFPRSSGVIGREVKNCHPPKSVHMVEEIIEKFRTGEKDEIDFWINKPDLFIYIKYVAVKDKVGRFRGVLEMMQDCTKIRNLEGSRTLIHWNDDTRGTDQRNTTTKNLENEPENAQKTVKADLPIPELGPDTMLRDLIAQYPQLKEDMAKINPKFKMLQTPMSKVMLPIASLSKISRTSGMPYNELKAKLEDLLRSYH